MVNEEGYVLLREVFKRSALWDHIADKLVILLDSTFLVGLAGITVKNFSSREAIV